MEIKLHSFSVLSLPSHLTTITTIYNFNEFIFVYVINIRFVCDSKIYRCSVSIIIATSEFLITEHTSVIIIGRVRIEKKRAAFWRCSAKKMFFKISILLKRLHYGCFFVSFAEFLRTFILQNICKRLLLTNADSDKW